MRSHPITPVNPMGAGRPKGKSAYPQDVRDKAYQLYLKNLSYGKIAKQLGVVKGTIHRWHKVENWSERRDKVVERTKDRIDKRIEIQRAADIKLCDTIVEVFGKQLERNPDMRISVNELVQVVKLRQQSCGGDTDAKIEVEHKLTLKDLFKEVDMGK